MLKLYLFMAAIALVLILITANIEISGAGNDSMIFKLPDKPKPTTAPMFDIYTPMENNASNIVLESAENITLRQYIANEPSNQEILNQQYNKYYWGN